MYAKNELVRTVYASREDYLKHFVAEIADLSELALCLTADAALAEKSLDLACEECLNGPDVAKEMISPCVRRQVVCCALRLVRNAARARCAAAQGDSNVEMMPTPGSTCGSPELVAQDDFHRTVYVLCKLERYSVEDCAALLNRSWHEVRDALERAETQIESWQRKQRIS